MEINQDPENEGDVFAKTWSPNVVRMRMVSLLDAQLEQITRDESRRQVERDVAAAILADRAAHSASLAAETEILVIAAREEERAATERAEALQRQLAEREAARLNSDGGKPTIDEVAQKSGNQRGAETFAEILCAAGLKCQAMRTQAIANRGPVKDGWVVNYHDQDLEIGLVATWWGRSHFQAYIEVAGHAGRTCETAGLFAELFTRAQGPGI